MGPFFFEKLSEWTLEILAPTVTYFKKNTFGATSNVTSDFGAVVKSKSRAVSYTHLTLPTSDLV